MADRFTMNSIRVVWTVPILAALLSGCSTTPVPDAAGAERQVSFTCSNGEKLDMRFVPAQGVGVLIRNGQSIELQQQPAASGFLYSNGPNTVRGKGDELTVEIGRMVPLRCKAS
jgi:membrane-bound inhibitor of C-type lysozyme